MPTKPYKHEKTTKQRKNTSNWRS